MYRKNKPEASSITANESYVGEMLEVKIYRMLNNKQPIKDPGVGLLYTERKDGVLAETDIRTDRWELAVDAMGHATKHHKAQRDKRASKNDKDTQPGVEAGGQSTDTTTK